MSSWWSTTKAREISPQSSPSCIEKRTGALPFAPHRKKQESSTSFPCLQGITWIPVSTNPFQSMSTVSPNYHHYEPWMPSCLRFLSKVAHRLPSRSAKMIVDEMGFLVNEYGAQDIAIVDSLFCANKRRVMAVCDEIIGRGLKISWTCSSRVEVSIERCSIA